MDGSIETTKPRTIGVYRAAVAFAVTTLILFVLCWALAAAGMAGSHGFVALFTVLPVASWAALATGSACALAFGGFTGALLAACYNMTGPAPGR